ncbi:MAG: stage II sporulation protein M [Oscillospiraceae bacterium]|nr:stage II sporulation protein M [Oscillospiraceae bacterium]
MSLRSFFTVPERLREPIPVTAGAFVVLTLIGFVAGLVQPELFKPLLDTFAVTVEERGLAEASGAELMGGILSNNLSALFIAMLLGLVPFLRLPAMELGLNALLLGAMAAMYQRGGLSLLAFLAGTLPHGVTELSALVLACAGGLHLCRTVNDALLQRGEPGAVGRAMGDCMLLYARFIVPLLLVSAFIEAFITPAILNAFL